MSFASFFFDRWYDNLDVTGPRKRPLDWDISILHALYISGISPNPDKDRIPARTSDPDQHISVTKALNILQSMPSVGRAGHLSAVEVNQICKKDFGLKVTPSQISQGEGHYCDLIWVLRMPAERLSQPVLFYDHPAYGPGFILDGCHRLMRAAVDGVGIDTVSIPVSHFHAILE